MIENAVLWEWLSLGVRWLHVITAIAWIGSSFYFIALDLGLRKHEQLPEGASGEEWQVHGGGFYHIQKYMVAPQSMPEHLTWFKWESYATWLSGFALLCVIYYAGADLYLVDANVLDVPAYQAILISLASIGLGWLFYDLLCKSPLGRDHNQLMILLFIVLVGASWGYTQLFSARAAYLHLGAFTATIMSANVFLIIIPNQKKVVASLMANEMPDPALGLQAKQRSTHNNYLTLPVLFLMLSNHYPLAFDTQYSWIIASLVFLMGVTIRYYFNSVHARTGKPLWTWGLTALLFAVIIWLSTFPKPIADEESEEISSSTHPGFERTDNFVKVYDTVMTRCSMCHAAEPVWEGIIAPPKGIVLETEEQVWRQARLIYINAGITQAMPPANVTFLEPEERQAIMDWYREVSTGSKGHEDG